MKILTRYFGRIGAIVVVASFLLGFLFMLCLLYQVRRELPRAGPYEELEIYEGTGLLGKGIVAGTGLETASRPIEWYPAVNSPAPSLERFVEVRDGVDPRL